MINGHRVAFVVAVDEKFGIGKDNTLPWRLKKELKYFHDTTLQVEDERKQNMVVMGSATWKSIPEGRRPLPNRKNVVLSRDTEFNTPGAFVATSIADAFALADDTIETIHIIGGAGVFEQAIVLEEVDELYITKIQNDYDCDRFFPEIPTGFSQVKQLDQDEENGTKWIYYRYSKE